MPAADLDFALAEFKERTKQIRQIMALVESAGRSPAALTTTRVGINLSEIAASTSNTANSMSLIFLASAFEEFVREQAIQCGNQLAENYAKMPTKNKNAIRDSYWSVSRDRFKFTRSILVNNAPEPLLLAKVKLTLAAMQGFVIDDDASKLDSQAFGHHSNNFRPGTVVEIFGRFAIKDLTGQLAENAKLKKYFGVSNKDECSKKLTAKWNEFYDRRNETVHSLSGKTGFAVDAIISYIELFELTAEALRAVLAKTVRSWP